MAKRFQLERVSGQPVDDAQLIADLRRVAVELGAQTVGLKVYRRLGRYDDTTVAKRFGSWNRALMAAGLQIGHRVDLPREELFENILNLWTHYGRQPRRAELALPPSRVSQSPYLRCFGSWTRALVQFVEFANASESEAPPKADRSASSRSTPRDPSLRLRFRVLQRDRFTCRSCGASPAHKLGVSLHVDHIVAWAEGGDTILENLQTLCEPCNLGKGTLDGRAG